MTAYHSNVPTHYEILHNNNCSGKNGKAVALDYIIQRKTKIYNSKTKQYKTYTYTINKDQISFI